MRLNLEIGVTVSKDLESLGTAVGRGAAPTLGVATGSFREEGAGLEEGSTVGMGSLFGASSRERFDDSAKETLLVLKG